MMQQETRGLKESEDGPSSLRLPWTTRRLRYPHRTEIGKILDFPDNDIRDEQTLSNTQREDWLLPNSPCMGLARDKPVAKVLR